MNPPEHVKMASGDFFIISLADLSRRRKIGCGPGLTSLLRTHDYGLITPDSPLNPPLLPLKNGISPLYLKTPIPVLEIRIKNQYLNSATINK